MPLTPIGETLSGRYSPISNLKKQINISKLLEIATQVITSVLGDNLSKLAKPLYLKNKTLTISCANSVVAQEIRLNQITLINLINESYGSPMVERLRYLL